MPLAPTVGSPMKFGAEDVKIPLIRFVHTKGPVSGGDVDSVSMVVGLGDLAIKGQSAFDCFVDWLDFDALRIRNHQRPVGECMGADGSDGHAFVARCDDGAAGGKIVSGGPGRRGDDQAIGSVYGYHVVV